MFIKLREREIEGERKVLDLPISDLQRIAIARALLKNAPILILDEVSFLFASLCIYIPSPSHHNK
jgi:ABC-type sugar transport system ATPase subunit